MTLKDVFNKVEEISAQVEGLKGSKVKDIEDEIQQVLDNMDDFMNDLEAVMEEEEKKKRDYKDE